MNNLEKELTTLEKKMTETFASEVRGMQQKELEFKLLQLSEQREDIVTAEQEDNELLDAKELVKELAGPYRDSLKENKIKARFVALLLKEKKEV